MSGKYHLLRAVKNPRLHRSRLALLRKQENHFRKVDVAPEPLQLGIGEPFTTEEPDQWIAAVRVFRKYIPALNGIPVRRSSSHGHRSKEDSSVHYGVDEGGTRFFVACSKAYASPSSFGSA